MIRRCSFLGCHGNAEHALRIYSPGKLRLDDSSGDAPGARRQALRADEVKRNFESAVGTVYFALPSDRLSAERQGAAAGPSRRARRVGGAEHHGVGIFPVFPAQDLAHDPEWNALAGWVGGQEGHRQRAACADMFMKLGLKPQ